MNRKNESDTSVKFGSSARASNATELSASGVFAPPDLPPGALPLDPLWELRPRPLYKPVLPRSSWPGLKPLPKISNIVASPLSAAGMLKLSPRHSMSAGASRSNCIMHSVFYRMCPACPVNIVESADGGRTRSIQHGRPTDFTLPRLHGLKFAERAFSYARPSAWNALSEGLRAVADRVEFPKQLKTHFSLSP